MTITILQEDIAAQGDPASWSDASLDWPVATTPGSALYLHVTMTPRALTAPHIVEPAGWTVLSHHTADTMEVLIARRIADGTETGVTITFEDSMGPITVSHTVLGLVEVSGHHEAITSINDNPASPHTIPDITPTGGVEALILAFVTFGNAYSITTPPAGYTFVDEAYTPAGSSERLTLYSLHEATTSGTYGGSFSAAGGLDRYNAFQVWLSALPVIDADFTATPTSGTAPLSVAFTDLSIGTAVTAWDWDFGDGGTSTSQNPTHVYSTEGSYTVTLVVTIDGDDYTVTKTAFIHAGADVGYTPPDPGRAILEIKATPPGADRWDLANWDEGRWSATTWQDVTPYGVDVQIVWGSNQPEWGILSTPDAATWAITFYDPDRVLDPANEDSPYFGDLQPYLPVRLRHNETVVKQGFLESASHTYEDGTGYWRVMDIQASLANAVVPLDTTLPDTLFARARAAISAAGLSMTVAPDPPGGDLDLAPWESQERTAWEWIKDAAQQVLWVPYIRNDNTLGFRDYRNPVDRGRTIGSPNLEGLQSVILHNGLLSIAGALELVSEGTDIIRREVTPKPRWGSREFVRDDPTPNSGDWAQAVLDDRSQAALRWQPARIVPFTASETQYFATMDAIERVTIDYPEATPPVLAAGIIVGGTIHVIGKQGDAAIWDFGFNIAQAALVPLVSDEDGVTYLVRDDDPTEYLYPDA